MPNIRNSLSKGVEVMDGRYGGVRMPIWWVRQTWVVIVLNRAICSPASHSRLLLLSLRTPISSQLPRPSGICLLNLPNAFPSIQPIYALVQATISLLDYCNSILAVILLPIHPPHCSQIDLSKTDHVSLLPNFSMALHYHHIRPIFLKLVFKASYSLTPTDLSSFSPSAPLYRPSFLSNQTICCSPYIPCTFCLSLFMLSPLFRIQTRLSLPTSACQLLSQP